MPARDLAPGKGAVVGISRSCEGRRQDEGGTGVVPRARDAERCGKLLLPSAGEYYLISGESSDDRSGLTEMVGLSSR
jgi:hypothetical protein